MQPRDDLGGGSGYPRELSDPTRTPGHDTRFIAAIHARAPREITRRALVRHAPDHSRPRPRHDRISAIADASRRSITAVSG
jgi:hypothetical protein